MTVATVSRTGSHRQSITLPRATDLVVAYACASRTPLEITVASGSHRILHTRAVDCVPGSTYSALKSVGFNTAKPASLTVTASTTASWSIVLNSSSL